MEHDQNDAQAIFTLLLEYTSTLKPEQKLYNILLGEFESVGEPIDHIIGGTEPEAGETTK